MDRMRGSAISMSAGAVATAPGRACGLREGVARPDDRQMDEARACRHGVSAEKHALCAYGAVMLPVGPASCPQALVYRHLDPVAYA
ncbi:protein of unknown function [Cupriavidus neocaledonicus]|uniref:Uncharacterized protein n=1 Tax=Cupriavidus neocaledonicus TaxID=1040979 RepID=A0A375H0D9_9BURK|nr:protein of unknown function [Cupriavidus neocaledonicus]